MTGQRGRVVERRKYGSEKIQTNISKNRFRGEKTQLQVSRRVLKLDKSLATASL